jgi:hypothetical protein
LGSSFCVLVLEALETAFGIYDLVRAGVERVAGRADIHLKVRDGASDLDYVTAVAGGGGVYELGMNAFFHNILVYYKGLAGSKESD